MNEDRVAKLKAFLEKDPDDSFTRYALALEYASRGDHQIAIAYLHELLERDPNYVAAYQQLGLNFAGLGKRKEAVEILGKGIQVATKQGDLHAKSEMQQAIDEMMDADSR